MGKLTRHARMRSCSVRLPCCCGDASTTVLAHAPSVTKGMGFKSEDWWGAWACATCHDALDGRVDHGYSDALILDSWMRGIHETQAFLFKHGLLREG